MYKKGHKITWRAFVQCIFELAEHIIFGRNFVKSSYINNNSGLKNGALNHLQILKGLLRN